MKAFHISGWTSSPGSTAHQILRLAHGQLQLSSNASGETKQRTTTATVVGRVTSLNPQSSPLSSVRTDSGRVALDVFE